MKNRMIAKLFLGLILSINVLTAKIIEIKNIAQVPQYVDESTLVFFDLDNTVLRSLSPWGRDECFSASLKYLENKYKLSYNDQTAIVLPSYRDAVNNKGIELVENDVTKIIKELKSNGNIVVALTARSTIELVNVTQKQLLEKDIQFSFYNRQHNFGNVSELTGALFAYGIMSCGNNNKGTCVKHFFDKFNLAPQKVVFIDDKIKYLNQLEESLKKLDPNIEFIGLRYGFCDKDVKTFILDKKAQQFLDEELKKHLPQKVEAMTLETI